MSMTTTVEPRIANLLLREEVAQFLYSEAELLDTRAFEAWTELLAEDLVYFMPIQSNVKFGEHDEHESTRQGQGISWFDEDKWTLTKRVEQIMTGEHYAEEPLSRVCRMVSAVQIGRDVTEVAEGETVEVTSRLLVYQNRGHYETALFVCRRYDTLRRSGQSWQIARREIILNQSVLLAKNLTVFF